MEGMVGKGSLKEVCSMFYIIYFFLVSSKSGVLNLLASDNVIQSPYHPYTLPLKINKIKRKELIPMRMGKRRRLLFNWSWLCVRPFSSHYKTEVLTGPRSMNSLLLETEQSYFVKETLWTALVTAVIKLSMDVESLLHCEWDNGLWVAAKSHGSSRFLLCPFFTIQ